MSSRQQSQSKREFFCVFRAICCILQLISIQYEQSRHVSAFAASVCAIFTQRPTAARVPHAADGVNHNKHSSLLWNATNRCAALFYAAGAIARVAAVAPTDDRCEWRRRCTQATRRCAAHQADTSSGS